MRVARVIAKLEPGGAQLSALRLTRATAELGIETRVIAGQATRDGGRIARDLGVDIEVWGASRPLQYACSPAFADWLRPRLDAADLVHAHMFGAWWAAAHAAPPQTPLVATEHNAYQWPGRPRTAEMRRALARVDLFFAHGPAARAAAQAAGVPLAKLRSGRSPVAGLGAAPDPRLARPRVVFAGRLEHEKGPDLLIEALALMEGRAAAYLLGGGSLARELAARARRFGVSHAVRFEGWRDDPAPWLAGAAACVVPSRYDAWSQTAVLAMALRTPVVAAAVEGLPEVCAGVRGVLVPPDDPRALAEALDMLIAGRRLTDPDAAEDYARQFDAPRVAVEYAREYAFLFGSSTSAASTSAALGEPRRRAA